MTEKSYTYLGTGGQPIGVVRGDDGLWRFDIAMNDADSDALAQAIADDLVGSNLSQQIATAIAANNPDTPNTDEATLINSGVHVNLLTSADQTTPKDCTGVLLFLNITVAAGLLKTLKLDIEAKDPASGVYNSIVSTGLIGTTVTVAGNYLMFACPFVGSLLAGLFGSVVQLPRTWRCKVTPNDGSSWTYSVGRCYLR